MKDVGRACKGKIPAPVNDNEPSGPYTTSGNETLSSYAHPLDVWIDF